MYRFSMKHRGRLDGKASALQHVAYILRDREGPAAAHVEYMLRLSETTRGREDLIASGSGNLPRWTDSSATTFWQAVEQHERINGRTATTWEVTLPRELTREEQLRAIQDLMQTQFGARHVYTWALHEARALDGDLNPHFHVAFHSRVLDGQDRTVESFFADPRKGGLRKDTRIHARGALLKQRQAWADIANWHLEHGRHTERLDARSLGEQGIAREPVARLNARHLTLAKYAHVYSEDLQKRETGRQDRQATWGEENARATQAWEARKKVLGLTRDLPHAQSMEQIRNARPPRRIDLEHDLHTTTQSVHTLEHHILALQVEQQANRAYAVRGHARPPGGQARVEQLLAQGRILGLEHEGHTRLPLIGNRLSQIYHEPGQPNYGDVVPRNQVLFWTYDEAHAAGFRRAANDHHGPGATTPMVGLAHAMGQMTPAQKAAVLAQLTPPQRAAVLQAQLQQQRAASVAGVAGSTALGPVRGLMHDQAGAQVKPPIDRSEGYA